MQRAVLGVAAALQRVQVVLRGLGLGQVLDGAEQRVHVAGVVFIAFGQALEQRDAAFGVRKEPQGGQLQRHLAQLRVGAIAMVGEAARAQARQHAGHQRLGGVQVQELEALVAARRGLEPLVFLRHVEVAPVDVAGKAGRLFLEPALVVGAGMSRTRGPGAVDGAEGHRRHFVVGRAGVQPGAHHLRQPARGLATAG